MAFDIHSFRVGKNINVFRPQTLIEHALNAGQRGTVQREKSMFLRKACLGGNITTFEMIPA